MSLEATVTDIQGNEEDWKELVTKTSQPETALNKRARRNPPSALAPLDRERVVLIKRRIELDLGSLDVAPLIAGVALSDTPVVLEMHLGLTIAWSSYLHGLVGRLSGPAPKKFHKLRLTGPEGSAVQITLLCNKLEWAVVYDIQVMNSIRFAIKRVAGWYQQFTTLALSLDHRGELAATLEYKITCPLQAEHSQMSLDVASELGGMAAELLPIVCPNGRPGTTGTVNSNEFIERLYTMPKDEVVPYAVQHESLQSELLQFQRRAVLWMLRREGVEFCETTGKLVPYDGVPEDGLPPTFYENMLPEGEKVYVSHIFGVLTKDRRAAFGLLKGIRGGLLAEEMGLGKTVELIALMLLHRPQFKAGEKVYDEDREVDVLAAKGTLIVVPTTLVDQWKAEIEQHAPSLKYFEYKGVKDKSTAGWREEGKGALELQQYDVVLTTYRVLSSELHFTEPPPERRMRNARVHVRKTSPLLDLSWWRVCLDEAQMVDGGYTNASKVARRIPRVNAWAISGTPLRSGIEDVRGLMLFLKIEPFANNGHVFNALVKHNAGSLESIFRTVGMRHTKEDVQDEINIPPQKRIVINIPFTPVEAQNYDNLFAQMCKDCGFDETGKPLVESEWKLSDYAEKMRSWLIRLRQTCTHPETGTKNKRAFGGKTGGLRTMVEVLQVMIDRHLVEYRNQERELCNSRLSRARMMMEEERQTEALEVMDGTLKFLAPIVAECRATVAEELKREEKKQKDEETADEYENEEEDDEDVTNPKKSRLAAARLRLRHFVDLQHACYFWIATASHQLTEEDPSSRRSKPTQEEIAMYRNNEVEYYDKAKSMRMELLAETRDKAVNEIEFLKKKAEKQDFVLFPGIEELGTGGIESQTILDNVEALAELLNDQAEQLDDWREKLITLLTKPVFDSGTDEDSGSELVDSVKESEEIFSYLLGIKLLLTNREQMLTGIKNILAAHEVEMQLENPSGVDIRVLSHLSRKCSKFQPTDSTKPMKQLLLELHRLANRKPDSKRSALESAVAAEKAQLLQKSYDEQIKLVQDALSKEARIFRNALNAKMDYYRQLQYVSDTVSELDLSQFGADEITPHLYNTLKENEIKLTQRIATAKARARYFAYLHTSSPTTSPDCLICLEKFDSGVLTSCGHAFCKRDLKMWWSLHRNCPSCKTKLQAADFYEITYSPLLPTSSPLKPRARTAAPSDTADAAANRLYTPCDRDLLRTITAAPLTVSYGSKIDLLTRHLLYLTRHSKTPLKAVIFSQWKEVLDLLSLSLSHHNISFASPAHHGAAAFRSDPTVPVFLLHARSQSSGLTLVNATHVFLIEPLLNIPLESQAVSRVHRIGQTAETTVWVYTVEGTVEQSVLRKREERGRGDGEGGEGGGEGGVLEGAKECVDKTGEVVADRYLWDCLFGARRREERGLRRELMAGAAEGRVEVAME